MNPTINTFFADIPEHEKQELRDAGFTEEDIAFAILLSHGLPNGDIIHLGLSQREGEDDASYNARYVAAIERGDYLCYDAPRLPEQE